MHGGHGPGSNMAPIPAHLDQGGELLAQLGRPFHQLADLVGQGRVIVSDLRLLAEEPH